MTASPIIIAGGLLELSRQIARQAAGHRTSETVMSGAQVAALAGRLAGTAQRLRVCALPVAGALALLSAGLQGRDTITAGQACDLSRSILTVARVAAVRAQTGLPAPASEDRR